MSNLCIQVLLFPRTVADWNALPEAVRLKPSVDSFRAALQTHHLPNCYWSWPWHSSSKGRMPIAGYSPKIFTEEPWGFGVEGPDPKLREGVELGDKNGPFKYVDVLFITPSTLFAVFTALLHCWVHFKSFCIKNLNCTCGAGEKPASSCGLPLGSSLTSSNNS